MNDEEFDRLRRAMRAGGAATMTPAKAKLFAVRLLAVKAAEALAKPSAEEEPEADRMISTGELSDHLALVAPTPQQMRRIAELIEKHYNPTMARPWWEAAARIGDEDAAAYLQELQDEEDAPGR